jgi:hypothetical protein
MTKIAITTRKSNLINAYKILGIFLMSNHEIPYLKKKSALRRFLQGQ